MADSGSGYILEGDAPSGGPEDYFYILELESFDFACGSPSTSELPGFPQPCTLAVTAFSYPQNYTATYTYQPASTDSLGVPTVRQTMDHIDFPSYTEQDRTVNLGYSFEVSGLGPTALFLDNVIYQANKV